MINTGLQFVTGGRAWGIFDRDRAVAGHEEMKKLSAYGYRGDRIEQRYKDLRFDGKLTFNKLTDVYHAAVGHDEDQPVHLHVLDTNICSTCAPKNTAIRVSDSARRLSTKWWKTVATETGACRSTSQTAFTARRATSWIRTRSSTGSRQEGGIKMY